MQEERRGAEKGVLPERRALKGTGESERRFMQTTQFLRCPSAALLRSTTQLRNCGGGRGTILELQNPDKSRVS